MKGILGWGIVRNRNKGSLLIIIDAGLMIRRFSKSKFWKVTIDRLSKIVRKVLTNNRLWWNKLRSW